MSKQNGIQKYDPKQLFNSDKVQQKFEQMLGKKAKGFVTSVLQTISNSSMLADADANSVYNAAMTAAVLDLPINQNLGFAYIIPYRVKDKVVAQFQMGYKGYIQLCQRSGLFKTISAAPIYKGQVVSEDPLRGFDFDFSVQGSDEVVGYASYFALLNGFEKIFYMTNEQVDSHAERYSQSYEYESSVWKTNFEGMALKTVLKRLLSKYAPMTIDMQTALDADQAEIKDVETMEVSYIDNPKSNPEPAERKALDISKNEADDATGSEPQKEEPVQANDQSLNEEIEGEGLPFK